MVAGFTSGVGLGEGRVAGLTSGVEDGSDVGLSLFTGELFALGEVCVVLCRGCDGVAPAFRMVFPAFCSPLPTVRSVVFAPLTIALPVAFASCLMV